MRKGPLILALVILGGVLLPRAGAELFLGAVLSTDKKSYRVGETMTLSLRNETGQKIYTNQGIVALFISTAEKLTGKGQWQEAAFSCLPPFGQCDIDASGPAPLASGATTTDQWVVGYDPISKARTIVDPGTYRLVGTYQVRPDGTDSRVWSWQNVYSNEFKIEK